MSSRQRYRNPPIIEALCEFHFKPGLDWDATMPGKLHAELIGEYPGKPRPQNTIEVELQFHKGSTRNLQLGERSNGVQLLTDNGRRLVGVRPNVLSVHMLHPYQDPPGIEKSGWDEFRPRIVKALAAYWSVAQPQGVKRIGVRYINKILIPEDAARTGDYLKCAWPEISDLPDQIIHLISRVEYVYPDGVKLVLSQGKAEDGFMLDLDVIWESDEVLSQMSTLSRIDALRDREREAFEAVITDKARRLFDAF